MLSTNNFIIIILVFFILILFSMNCYNLIKSEKVKKEKFGLEESESESHVSLISEVDYSKYSDINSLHSNLQSNLVPESNTTFAAYLHHQIVDEDIKIPAELSEQNTFILSNHTKRVIDVNNSIITNLLNELKENNEDEDIINSKIQSENTKIANIIRAEYLDQLSQKFAEEGNDDNSYFLKHSADIIRLKTESLIKMDSLQEIIDKELSNYKNNNVSNNLSSIEQQVERHKLINQKIKRENNDNSNLKRILTEYYHHLYKLKQILKYIRMINNSTKSKDFLQSESLNNQENKIKLLNNLEEYKYNSNSNNIVINKKINTIISALAESEFQQKNINNDKYNKIINFQPISENQNLKSIPSNSELITSKKFINSKPSSDTPVKIFNDIFDDSVYIDTFMKFNNIEIKNTAEYKYTENDNPNNIVEYSEYDSKSEYNNIHKNKSIEYPTMGYEYSNPTLELSEYDSKPVPKPESTYMKMNNKIINNEKEENVKGYDQYDFIDNI